MGFSEDRKTARQNWLENYDLYNFLQIHLDPTSKFQLRVLETKFIPFDPVLF